LRVHVRLDLEHEAGERSVVRPDRAAVRVARRRWRREREEAREERLDAEVGERAAEERRRGLAPEERVGIELAADLVQQRDLLAQPRERGRADPRLVLGRIERRALRRRARLAVVLPALEEVDEPLATVVHAREA